MKDGLILMYVKDGTIYPIAMTSEQLDVLQILGGAVFDGEPVIVINKPQGKAVDVMDEYRKERGK